MGGTLCSVIIPVAPSHLEIVTDAIASVQAQTVPCEVIVEYDHDQRGAAHTRNKGVRRSNGLFLVMLDADDILHPTYVESALRAYRPGGYVYSHWIGTALNTTLSRARHGIHYGRITLSRH